MMRIDYSETLRRGDAYARVNTNTVKLGRRQLQALPLCRLDLRQHQPVAAAPMMAMAVLEPRGELTLTGTVSFDTLGIPPLGDEVVIDYKIRQRNKDRWHDPLDDMPVYGTMAAHFNDAGTNALFQALMRKLTEVSEALRPEFEIGDTVEVHTKILEGDKERVQIFSGTVIARSGSGTREMRHRPDRLFIRRNHRCIRPRFLTPGTRIPRAVCRNHPASSESANDGRGPDR